MARWRDLYFDRVYTPVYDATVGRMAPYRRLQERCLGRLALHPGDTILSVGVGTGNELARLFRSGPGAGSVPRLVAVDISLPALERARRKAHPHGGNPGTTRDPASGPAPHVERPAAPGAAREPPGTLDATLDLARVDAHHLALKDACCDAVLCIHTMDFLADSAQASREILRVLKPGGQLAATYPTGRGGRGLGREIAGSVLAGAHRGRPGPAVREALGALGAGLAYVPLALSVRPGGFYTRTSLERLLRSIGAGEHTIEEDPVYQDLIVWGRKTS